MIKLDVTVYETTLLIEALTRASARRNSMAKASSNVHKRNEHQGVADQMDAIIRRLERIKKAA